jgi:glutamate---cysteine ligase / carboxylate-amine ligase
MPESAPANKQSPSMSNDYKIGIEEEYFVVDLKTRNLRTTMPKKFYRTAKALLKDRLTTEMLQCQIEVTTSPCKSIGEARQELARLRRALAENAGRHGLGIMAAATHPIALWREQKQTEKERYGKVMNEIQMIGLRDLLCGMHVHVELPDPARRVEVMYRAIPFLPMLLALSTSSPFWQGRRTGLLGYRLAAYDELPRTGLPELFRTSAEYDSYVDALVAAGLIENASFIWWAIRPSLWHPTLELRIPDACTRIEDGICIAALFRCLTRHLFDHPELNADIGPVDRALAVENKWRAQRYGIKASFIERGSTAARTMRETVDDLLDRLHADAQALDCVHEIAHARTILARGSSAHQQVQLYSQARIAGRSRPKALKDVVDFLLRTTVHLDNDAIIASSR